MANVDVTRIAGNIGAANALNALTGINKQLAMHQSRLQTGKQINSAADDPAGYTIATKMLARSEGLKVALNNISDASNMLSVAESGLSKMNDILTQMRGKAEQAASDTLGTTERQAIQTQLSAFAEQIDNIASETKWNGVKLLDGTVAKTFQTGADVGETTSWTLSQNHGAGATGLAISTNQGSNGLAAGQTTLSGVGGVNALQTTIGTFQALQTGNYQVQLIDQNTTTNLQGKVVSGGTFGSGAITLSQTGAAATAADQLANGSNTLMVKGYNYVAGGTSTINYSTDGGATWSGVQNITGDVNLGAGTIALKSSSGAGGLSGLTLTIAQGTLSSAVSAPQSSTVDYIQAGYQKAQLQTRDGNAVTVSSGGNASNYLYLNGNAAGSLTDTGRGLNVASLAWSAGAPLGATSSFKYVAKNAHSVDVSTSTDASNYMQTVTNAMDTVNNSMASLGSLMARLDFKSDQVSSAQINVEASYNRIMNANMAEEQMNASKYSILQQTATAMLAQANQAPQSLLPLFR